MSFIGCRDVVRCLCILALFAASGVAADGKVTLQALTIYNTHEWFGLKPKVYFQCAGESKVQLPDVKAKNQLYTFQGQESFQPLTTLVGIQCKRCGLYEQDSWNPDDVFGRWELCPLDFSPKGGRYFRLNEGEFNLTLSCPSCNQSVHVMWANLSFKFKEKLIMRSYELTMSLGPQHVHRQRCFLN